ncbi:hypothetical protein V6N13_089488 [Hibiscus sabdariffa]
MTVNEVAITPLPLESPLPASAVVVVLESLEPYILADESLAGMGHKQVSMQEPIIATRFMGLALANASLVSVSHNPKGSQSYP